MSWIDTVLTSSLIVWILLIIGVLHLYLKKTGKTLPELIKEIIAFFNSLGGEEQ